MAVPANSPDPAEKANSDLRSLGESLLRISRMLHEHTRKLEVAVEGTYAGESGDPRVRLLSDSLRISRTADLELGRLNQNAQRVLLSFQDRLNRATQSSPVQPPPPLPGTKSGFEREFQVLNTNISNLERKRNELETLYEIARVLNSTLEFDKVLRLVMDEVIDVVKAERGFLVLVNPSTRQLEFTIARDKEKHTIDQSAFQHQISRSTVDRVVSNRMPIVTDDAMIDDDLKGQKSIMTYGIRSIMCVPLMVRGNCIGAVYVDSRINSNLFSSNHRDLMLAFCHQAAIAIDNARLFADLNQALRRVEEDKSYMDNIFASIVPQVHIVEFLQNAMALHDHGTIVPNNIDCDIAGRGMVNLSIYVSSLRDTQGTHIGMALVVDDRTELKRSEARVKEVRRIFGRFVHPNVVQRLIEDPSALNLGGAIKEITVISADIRGFTRLNERMASGEVVNLLNTYLDIMVKEIWDEGGTITGFWGDELMAIFNAPLNQDDHVLRAVRAAWKTRLAVLEYQHAQPRDTLISFGFGVNTGEAMVGNIGSREHMQTYTAIGDAVNIASRLQSNSSDNNILLNHSTFIRVRQHVQVTRLPPLEVKNKTEPLDVWRLTGLC